MKKTENKSQAHRKLLEPVLYDWLATHNLEWPSYSCRWGPQIKQATYKNRQRLYLSEKTDGSVPNTLLIANCKALKPRVAAAARISQFSRESLSPFVKKFKTILYPGEVNRIRELPHNSNIIATITCGPDRSPDVLIWDVESQPDRQAVLGAAASRPDLILTGPQDNVPWALAMCPTEPFVLTGGEDKSVVLWSIHDHIFSHTKAGSFGGKSSSKVAARGIFLGHEDSVANVQFCPSSAQEFCSVGHDSCLILWDARTGTSPVVKVDVENAHDSELLCVDWNPHDINFILTGSDKDDAIDMFDRRKMTSRGVGVPLLKFEGHTAPVVCVQWCPDKSSVFGSSSGDGILNIWDYEKVGHKQDSSTTKGPHVPPGLFFQHAGGHRGEVYEFCWNTHEPWTIASISKDDGREGILQIWRMSELIYRTNEEIMHEILHI